MNKPEKIIVHHLNGMRGNSLAQTKHHTAEIIDVHHSLHWPGFTSKVFKNNKGKYFHCGYHDVFESGGKMVHTRAYHEEGAHTIGMNKRSIGQVFCGNYDRIGEEPDEGQKQAFVKRFKQIKKQFPHITAFDVEPHRKYATKSCFGSQLPDDYFTKLIQSELTVKEAEEDTREFESRSVLVQKIEQLRQIIALLTQILSMKRLSGRQKIGWRAK